MAPHVAGRNARTVAGARSVRDVGAAEGTAVDLVVSGETPRRWRLHRGPEAWTIGDAVIGAPPPRARVMLPGDVAWRLFFNALEYGPARRQVQVDGDESLAEPLFRVRSVMV